MKLKTILLPLAAMVGLTFTANAGSIGVNTGPAGQEINGQLAGAEVQQFVWNDKMNGGGFGTSHVVDDSGALLTTTVSVQTQWANTTGAGTSDGDHSLMNGTMDNNGGPQGFTISLIPYALYDVYIYHEGGNNAGRGGSFQVWDSDNGDAVLATQDSYDTSTFNGTWVEASTVGTGGTGIDDNGTPGDTSDDFAVNSNYIKFTGLSAPNIKIRSIANTLGNPDVPRAPIPAFQIVEAGAKQMGLLITRNVSNPSNFDFVWKSKVGKFYDLVSSTDYSIPIGNWAIWNSHMNLTATPPTNMLTNVPGGGNPSRCFAVIEK